MELLQNEEPQTDLLQTDLLQTDLLQTDEPQNDPQTDPTQNDPPTLTININDISQWQCNYNLTTILTYLTKAIQTTNQLRQQQFETVNSLIDQIVQEDVILLMQSLQKYSNNWYFQKQFFQLTSQLTDTDYNNTAFKITLLPINPFTLKGILSLFNHLSSGIYAATYNCIGALIFGDSNIVRYSQQRKDRPLSVYLLKRFKYQIDADTKEYKKVSTQIYIIAQTVKEYSLSIDIGQRSNQIFDKWKITQSIWKIEIPTRQSTDPNTTITLYLTRMFKIFEDEILPTEGTDQYTLHCPYYPYVEKLLNADPNADPNTQEQREQDRTQPEFQKAILTREFADDSTLRSDISFKVSDWTSIADPNGSNTLSSNLQFIISDYKITDVDDSYNVHDDFGLNEFEFYVIEPKEEYWSKYESQTYEELLDKIKEQLQEQMQQ